MKIQLLVYGGKILVQGLQLREPGRRTTTEKYSFQINVVLVKWWTFSMWTLWSHLQGFQQEMLSR